jgi:hypothetical protein
MAIRKKVLGMVKSAVAKGKGMADKAGAGRYGGINPNGMYSKKKASKKKATAKKPMPLQSNKGGALRGKDRAAAVKKVSAVSQPMNSTAMAAKNKAVKKKMGKKKATKLKY